MTIDDAAKLQTEIREGLSNPPHRDSAQAGWMVQYQDDNGRWIDYQWTENPTEERSMVKHLERHGNRARTIIAGEPQP